MLENWINILFCALSFCTVFTFVQSQVGESCNLPVIGNPGVCKPVAECPGATVLNHAGIKPFICGYVNNLPIVCCEGTSTRPKQPPAQNKPTLYTSATTVPPVSVTTKILNHRPRKSDIKCTGYRKLVTQVIDPAQGTTNSKEVPLCDFDSSPLIIGGAPAEPGEFPHMAILGYRSSDDGIAWQCGGSLISELYVLTAAHCIRTQFGPPIIVRLGDLNLAIFDDGTDPEEFTIAKLTAHPVYNRPKVYNDIALIRLSRPAKFNKFIRPACLWTRSNTHVNDFIATGWGVTKNGGPFSDTLQKVTVGFIEPNTCKNYYEDSARRLPQGVIDSMICAGNLTAAKDTCQGDSGGPLQITSDDNPCLFHIVGVTSFGRGCATQTPAIYTRVYDYLDWIESIVWP